MPSSKKNKRRGGLLLALHAHMPYVREPRHERFLEESWLCEAVTWCYAPLLSMLDKSADEGLDFHLVFSISPTLIEMLDDDLLMSRYEKYLERLIRLADNEVVRTRKTSAVNKLAWHYRRSAVDANHFNESGGVLKRLKKLSRSGHITLITTSATHAFLPNLRDYPAGVQRQISVGLETFKDRFKRDSKGLWLPECGYYEGLDNILNENGIGFSFLESHGLGGSKKASVYQPVRTDAGVVFFLRDPDCSEDVWSREKGYPGSPVYRDFYRDIGFDLSLDELDPFAHPDGIRIATGFKYHRITGDTVDKKIYDLDKADTKARKDARDFLDNRTAKARKIYEDTATEPVFTAAYDAELFGHWWYEGVLWLEELISIMNEDKSIGFVRPGDFLKKDAIVQTGEPLFSSWGRGGYGRVWCSKDGNDWAIRHLHRAEKRMKELTERFRARSARSVVQRAVRQAEKELLLMEASDWPFMIENKTSRDYGLKRLEGHITAFNLLYEMIIVDDVDEEYLMELELKDNIFDKT